MTLQHFWRTFVRIGSGQCPEPHREQSRYIASVDEPMPTRRESFLHWAKKAAKSFTSAVRGLHYLVGEHRDPDDRLIGIASFDEEQSKVIFALVGQLVTRHPWLTANVRMLRNEAVYEEQCRDERTGGSYTRTHRLRALARDTAGLHGEPWSLVLRDEFWSEPNHAMSEALIPSPARPFSDILYTSYSTLATMRKPGVPMHDLLARVEQHDPTVFYSFVGGSGADASWLVCSWVSSEWVDQQRRIFAASPTRFRRVVLNEQVLGGDGDTLLTLAELDAARTDAVPVLTWQPGARRIGGLDLGVTNDHAVLVIGDLDPDGVFQVLVVQIWKPEPGQPVSFSDIEDAAIGWHRQLGLGRLNIDQWNATLLTERLQRAGVPARQVGVEQTMIDRIVTTLKNGFTRRAVRIQATELYLFEQLESLRTLETRTPRRDLLKFAPSGTGPDASRHDDAAVALGLCLVDDAIRDKLGRVAMDEIRDCNLSRSTCSSTLSVFFGEDRISPPAIGCVCASVRRTCRRGARMTAMPPAVVNRWISARLCRTGALPNRYAGSRRLRLTLQHRGMI